MVKGTTWPNNREIPGAPKTEHVQVAMNEWWSAKETAEEEWNQKDEQCGQQSKMKMPNWIMWFSAGVEC